MLPALIRFAAFIVVEHPTYCAVAGALVVAVCLGLAGLFVLYRSASPNGENTIHTHFNHLQPQATASSKAIRVIVVFGWLGAKRKHLRRLLQSYDEELQVNTISYISSPLRFIDSSDYHNAPEWSNICESLISLRKQSGNAPLDIFIHLHSNNGVLALTKFYGALSSPRFASLLPSLRAVFFDCAPYLPPYARLDTRGEVPKPPRGLFQLQVLLMYGWRSTAAAMIAMRGQSFHPLLSPLLFASAACLMMFNVLVRGRAAPHEMFSEMRSIFSANRLPLFFVYSQADKLIPAAVVKDWIKECRNNGQHVSEMEVGDAQHVDVFRHHKEKYLDHIKHMMDKYGSK